MARMRVHELAKEWDLETKELTARLEKIGIRGKRSQSSLTEEEVERARKGGLGLAEKPSVTIGEERVLTGDAGERIVERRVGTKVIRRRSAAPAAPAPEALLTRLEPLATQSRVLQVFTAPEPLPEIASDALDLPLPLEEAPEPPLPAVGEELPTAEQERPDAAPEQPVLGPESTMEAAAELEPAAAAPKTGQPGQAPEQSVATQRPLGPKVLGRIDLKKASAERAAGRPRPAVAGRQRPAAGDAGRQRPAVGDAGRERPAVGDAGRGRRLPAEIPPAPLPEPARPGKRKKRRVIQKPEFAELGEREKRLARLPRKKRAQPGKEQKKTEITMPKASKRVVRISEVISAGELAKAMGIKAGEVVKKLMESGMMANVNQVLDADTAILIASEFGYNVENVIFDAESAVEVGHEPSLEEMMQPRPPVITIMGHVDHGKTSLLDAVRETDVTAGEAGGITQHIGAYLVDVDGKRVCFLDTPGHEAFTAMRARGAKVTDIVVLVVAADDGVMPQTVEAINHARAAGVPIVVAINKIDKPDAKLDRIKQDLANHGLVPEDWGGDTVCVSVSAKTGEGLPHLLEMLQLQAELLELKANYDKPSRGTIVEARLDRGRGAVATVLVQEGTLRIGNAFVCGPSAGRVRAMVDDKGHKVKEASASTPVEILGLAGVPEAGSSFVVVAEDVTARQVAEHRAAKQREASLLKTSKVSLEDLHRQMQAGDTKELRVVIKADVQGSAEALTDSLGRLSGEDVKLNVLHASVGGISESDMMLASASNAVVIGFSVRPEPKATAAAAREGVDVRLYTVIYDVLRDVRDAMEGLLEPTLHEKVVGRADVRDIFTIPSIGAVAGCYVNDGKVSRNVAARLVRDHVVVYTGKVASLRRFKEDAREVSAGYECGVGLDSFQDVKVGDVIEVFEIEQVARRLGGGVARGAAVERSL